MKLRPALLTLVVAAFALTAAGCSKVTLENYEKIQTGMTLAEVESILGSGETQAGGGVAIGETSLSGKVVVWGDDEKHIKVTFANGKVTLKAQKGL